VIILDDSLGILTNPLIISGMDSPDIFYDKEEDEREDKRRRRKGGGG
jgi:hypothetical protein